MCKSTWERLREAEAELMDLEEKYGRRLIEIGQLKKELEFYRSRPGPRPGDVVLGGDRLH